MQRRLDPETSVNKPFQYVSYQGRIQNFFQGRETNFLHFFKCSFSADLILINLSSKNDSRGGSGVMLPGKTLKICILQSHFSVF